MANVPDCKSVVVELHVGVQVPPTPPNFDKIMRYMLGRRVYKKSGKPFKSREKINTVKGMVVHPVLGVNCFTFEEDDSYVECRRCLPAEE